MSLSNCCNSLFFVETWGTLYCCKCGKIKCEDTYCNNTTKDRNLFCGKMHIDTYEIDLTIPTKNIKK